MGGDVGRMLKIKLNLHLAWRERNKSPGKVNHSGIRKLSWNNTDSQDRPLGTVYLDCGVLNIERVIGYLHYLWETNLHKATQTYARDERSWPFRLTLCLFYLGKSGKISGDDR